MRLQNRPLCLAWVKPILSSNKQSKFFVPSNQTSAANLLSLFHAAAALAFMFILSALLKYEWEENE